MRWAKSVQDAMKPEAHVRRIENVVGTLARGEKIY